MARDLEQFFDEHQKNVIKGLRFLQEAAQNTELGTKLFRDADTGVCLFVCVCVCVVFVE